MPLCRDSRPDGRWLRLVLCVLLLIATVSAAAKGRPASGLDPGYVSALATADHFLQAWQAGDVESGTALLTTHAKKAVNRDNLDRFFSYAEPAGYEINRGTLVKRGRYEFPVVLVTSASKSPRIRRRFSSIVIVNTGTNEWAVDKLP